MAGRFSVEAVFKAVDRVTAPVSRMQNRVGKFTRGAGQGFHKLNRSVEKFSNGVKRGAVVVAASTALIGAALAGVVTTGAQFEQTIVNAAAKFPGEIRRGTEAFKALEEAARQTGKTTEFTASQSAEALNFLAMAGFSAEGAVAALPGVVDLATAASIDLATASDIATDSLGALGLATKDTAQLQKNLARVNDVMAKTATTANTSIEAMFEALKEAGPLAVTAGQSFETTAALIGELANSGKKGSDAGTILKNVFTRLAAPVAKGAKLLNRFGVQTKDANGDLLDVVDILGQLDKSLAGLGTAERSGVLEGIFGKIPLAGVNILLQSGSKRLNEYRRELEGASGASSTMATVMRDTVQGRLNSLKSAVEGVSISIFSMNRGPLVDVIERLTDWTRANEQLIATGFGDFVANAIPPLKTFAGFIGSIANFIFELGSGLGIVAAKMVIAFENVVSSPAFRMFINSIQMVSGFLERGFGQISTGFGLFGGGDGAQPVAAGMGAAAPQVVSPQERTARSIEEQRTTSTAEVTIKDETGRAEVSAGLLGRNIQMSRTGAF